LETPKKLSVWTRENLISTSELERRSGVSDTTILRYLAGTQRLEYKTAKALSSATNNEVSFETLCSENDRRKTITKLKKKRALKN